MADFIPQRDRDAWSTIRGYVYQVDLTIKRWLDLQPDQILELERGEDIDLISRSLLASEEQQRLLEQVKHRDVALTLRTSSAIAFIANSIAHRKTHPNSKLVFRYSTNAQITSERPSPIPQKIPAITVWEQIRLQTLGDIEQSRAIKGIRIILGTAPCPQDIPDDIWTTFVDFVRNANDLQFLELIRVCEWSGSSPAAQEMKPLIQQILIDRRRAKDRGQSEEQYLRLFFYTINLLCQPGLKQLTVEKLNLQLSLPPLSETDRDLLHSITVRTGLLEARVGDIEQNFLQLNDQIQQIAKAHAIDAAISYTVATPILDVPPAVTHLSQREETVKTLADIVMNHTWTAIYGGAGSGKTQLAILLANSLSISPVWISLRDLDTARSCIRLDAAFHSLIGMPLHSDRGYGYRQFCESRPDGLTVVLDDVPRLLNNDGLSERLLQMVVVFSQYNIRLLSTSAYALPFSMQESLAAQLLHMLESPSFSDYEAGEILHSYGAPSSLLEPKTVNFLNAQAHQHPWLIAALAQYLRQQNWQITDKVFEGLLRNEYATGISAEVINRLLNNIEDATSRELLYRLNLILGNFSIEDVQALASVDPLVDRPRERLNTLIGLWIQRDVRDHLLVSPLVKTLGETDLHPNTRKASHFLLGHRILKNGVLDQLDVINAVSHFVAAESLDDAGYVLIFALSHLNNTTTPVRDYGLLAAWSELPIPRQMSLGVRIYLRGLQIAVRHKHNKDVLYLISDLDELTRQVRSQEGWAIVGALAIAGPVLAEGNLPLANRLFLTAIHLLPNASTPDGKPLMLPAEFVLESFLWVNVAHIETVDRLRDWVEIVKELTPEARQRAFADIDLAENGCLFVTEGLWLAEAAKPVEQQQWDVILQALQSLAVEARQLGLDILWACAVRAQMVVLAHFMHELVAADHVAREALDIAANEPRVQFLIRECVGRQYVDEKQYDTGLIYLRQALDQSTTAYPKVRLYALLDASLASGSDNPDAAIGFAEQAVHLAESDARITEFDLIKSLCELAIAQWLAGFLADAFVPWNKAAEYLLASRADSAEWKELFVVYGHANGYFSMLAHEGYPPTELEDGEPYAPPTRGIFLIRNPKRAALYTEERECFIFAQLAMFAEAVGKDDIASKWALQGLDLARANNQLLVLSMLSADNIPYLLQNDRYSESLDFALESQAISVAIGEERRAGRDTTRIDFDFDAILGSGSNNLRQKAEYYAAMAGLLPMAFRIGTLKITQVERARSCADEVVKLCQQISATAADPDLWLITAELFEKTYLQDASSAELMHRSNALDPDDYQALRAIGYLGATLQTAVSLKDALSTHLAIMPYVFNIHKPPTAMYRLIILPFIVDYWTQAFEKMRFRFRSPKLVEADLHEAKQAPERLRAQFILRTIAQGLDLRLPTEVKQWLQGDVK